ncbi:MAG: NAD-dependent epimerase/dehydratase family protein [Candidatus Lokiarchaeota archaeon]|nr:NAD-dependent epimerase/dehydratase family protein [Candidatus Lokiarchaeota archaeon]
MKILITGSSGYLGKSLIKKSLEKDMDVIGVDIKPSDI